ncbi:SDR family oxidoreductase [Chloroflexota bacterium]
MEKVLVAGSTGYLGRFVVKEFKRQGYWVRALARNPEVLRRRGVFLEPAIIDHVDETFTGEITKPETLDGICNDIDIVFSSVGITRQKDGLTFQDVDYQGNVNLLNIASKTKVSKFVYVSLFNADKMGHLAIVKAHEDFVKVLKSTGIDYTVIRPTGYFSDISEYLKMAKSGRVYLFGKGESRLNPIHGEDLAKVCVDSVPQNIHELPVGGPEEYSQNEIAKLVFAILYQNPKITHIPSLLARIAIKFIRPFNKHESELLDFFVTAGQQNMVAPPAGSYSLKHYYQELLSMNYKRELL